MFFLYLQYNFSMRKNQLLTVKNKQKNLRCDLKEIREIFTFFDTFIERLKITNSSITKQKIIQDIEKNICQYVVSISDKYKTLSQAIKKSASIHTICALYLRIILLKH